MPSYIPFIFSLFSFLPPVFLSDIYSPIIKHDPVVRSRIDKDPAALSTYSSMKMGNLFIISFNTYTSNETEEDAQLVLIHQLLSENKPSILALQASSKDLLSIRNTNYNIVGEDVKRIDVELNKEEYRPIIYDKNIVKLLQPNEISSWTDSSINSDQIDQSTDQISGTLPTHILSKLTQPFATYALFKHIESNTKLLFINVDIFSSIAEQVNKQLNEVSRLIKDITESNTDIVVIVAGSIEPASESINIMLKQAYDNLLDEDINNINMMRNTLVDIPANGDIKERDYIMILKGEGKDKYKINLARILTEWGAMKEEGKEIKEVTRKEYPFSHYPIAAIMTLE